jgi:hypothetical protein
MLNFLGTLLLGALFFFSPVLIVALFVAITQ